MTDLSDAELGLLGATPKLIEGNEYEYESMAFAGDEHVVVAGKSLGGSRAQDNPLEFEQARGQALRRQWVAPVSTSKRTRWLTFVNERGSVVMAPGVRTHQLSLLFGMGKDWYGRAMAFPELKGTGRTYGSVAVNVGGQELKALDSLNYGAP